LKNFTGIDSAYEPPQAPEVHLQTVNMKPESCIDPIIRALLENINCATFNDPISCLEKTGSNV
jgi:adenylylsulfate kinase-like enzyme